MNKIALVGFMVVMMACKSVVPVSQPEVKDPIQGMVFLTFVMKNDSIVGTGKRIDLIAKTIINQKLKSDPQPSTAPNRLLIRQLDATENTLSMVPVDHPLFRRVEYADEKGEFVSKIVKLADAEFFARVTLFSETQFIQVEEEVSGKIIFTAKFNIRD